MKKNFQTITKYYPDEKMKFWRSLQLNLNLHAGDIEYKKQFLSMIKNYLIQVYQSQYNDTIIDLKKIRQKKLLIMSDIKIIEKCLSRNTFKIKIPKYF